MYRSVLIQWDDFLRRRCGLGATATVALVTQRGIFWVATRRAAARFLRGVAATLSGSARAAGLSSLLFSLFERCFRYLRLLGDC